MDALLAMELGSSFVVPLAHKTSATVMPSMAMRSAMIKPRATGDTIRRVSNLSSLPSTVVLDFGKKVVARS